MPTIDLTVAGPTEHDWDVVCGTLPTFSWPDCDRLIVVSPHPDDETLGVGGLIATAVERNVHVLVVAVSDGEAATNTPGLAEIRAGELAAALSLLGPVGTVEHRRLRLPDGDLQASIDTLTTKLEQHLRSMDLVLCPLPDDGHPDHHAASVAATRAARRIGAQLRWFPVWAWHSHDPRCSPLSRANRVVLSANARARKQRAMACYVSQLEGPDPVVPAKMLIRLDRPYEVLVEPG